MWRPSNNGGEVNPGDALLLTECPASYTTRESERWVAQFLACRTLRAPPLAGGVLEWPARLVDAFLLLEEEALKTEPQPDA